jgi:hypothetical protein
MVKIVFLSVPVSGGYFPLRKGTCPAFFTVKHIFSRIKLWLVEPANREAKRRVQHEEA